MLTGAEKESMKIEYDGRRKTSQTTADADKAAAVKDNKKVVNTFNLESVLQYQSTDVSALY